MEPKLDAQQTTLTRKEREVALMVLSEEAARLRHMATHPANPADAALSNVNMRRASRLERAHAWMEAACNA